MSMVKELIFKVSEKVLKDGSKAFILTDSDGYVCGIYDSVERAEKAIPAVKRNITNGYVTKSVLYDIPAHATIRPQTRQLSRKKLTVQKSGQVKSRT